jgi:hypothetical protein
MDYEQEVKESDILKFLTEGTEFSEKNKNSPCALRELCERNLA